MDKFESGDRAGTLLMLDGGGVRGYASLLILQRLMDSIREIEVAHPEGDHSPDMEERPEKPFSREKLSHTEPHKKARKLSEKSVHIVIKRRPQKATSQDEDFCWKRASKPSSVAFSDGAFSNDTVDDTASSTSTSASYTISRAVSSQSSATEWTTQDDVTLPGFAVDNKAPFSEQKDFLPSDYFDTIVGTSTGGVIAIMLGRLRMSVNDCLRSYELLFLSTHVRAREDSFKWKDPLTFDPSRDRTYTPPEYCDFALKNLSSYPATTTALRETFCFIFETNRGRNMRNEGGTPLHFSLKESSGPKQWSVFETALRSLCMHPKTCDSARAASAAPGFFKNVTFWGNGRNGGVFGGNTSSLENGEALIKDLFWESEQQSNLPIFLVVSLPSSRGSHSSAMNQNHLNGASFQQISRHGTRLRDQHHDSGKVERWLDSQATVGESLFCQLGETLKDLDLNDGSTLESMKSLISEYISRDNVRDQLNRCAWRLVLKRRWRREKPARPHCVACGLNSQTLEIATNVDVVHDQSAATKYCEMLHANAYSSTGQDNDTSQTAASKVNPSQNSRTEPSPRAEVNTENRAFTWAQISNLISNYALSSGAGHTRVTIRGDNRAESDSRDANDQESPSGAQTEPQKSPPSVSQTEDINQCQKRSECKRQTHGANPNPAPFPSMSMESSAIFEREIDFEKPISKSNLHGDVLAPLDSVLESTDEEGHEGEYMSCDETVTPLVQQYEKLSLGQLEDQSEDEGEDDSIEESLFWESDESMETQDLEEGHPFLSAKNAILDHIILTYSDWVQSAQEGDDGTCGGNGSSPYIRPPPPGRRSAGREEKRKRPADDDSGLGNDLSSSLTVSVKRSRSDSGGLTFACPFCKKDPGRYGICYNHKLSRIGDVKQHLLRRHVIPIYCSSCNRTFDNEEDRDNHTRERTCEIRPKIVHDGVTAQQKKLLRKRTDTRLSEEEQWYKIFEILFPRHRRPESPYINQVFGAQVQHLRDYVTQEGPAIIMEHLAARESQDFPTDETNISSFQHQLFREALQKVVQQWESGVSQHGFLNCSGSSTSTTSHGDGLASGLGENLSQQISNTPDIWTGQGTTQDSPGRQMDLTVPPSLTASFGNFSDALTGIQGGFDDLDFSIPEAVAGLGEDNAATINSNTTLFQQWTENVPRSSAVG